MISTINPRVILPSTNPCVVLPVDKLPYSFPEFFVVCIWTPVSLCFWARAQGFETPDFFAVCRACVKARKTPQKPEQTPISEKLADRGINRCVDPPIFRKLVFFRAIAAFSARLQTLGTEHICQAHQQLGPRKRGKMASEGRNRNFRWRAAASR